jgi:hypothetical protein
MGAFHYWLWEHHDTTRDPAGHNLRAGFCAGMILERATQ